MSNVQVALTTPTRIHHFLNSAATCCRFSPLTPCRTWPHPILCWAPLVLASITMPSRQAASFRSLGESFTAITWPSTSAALAVLFPQRWHEFHQITRASPHKVRRNSSPFLALVIFLIVSLVTGCYCYNLRSRGVLVFIGQDMFIKTQ